MALGDRDYRAVLELVGEAHDAASVDELRALLLPALRRMVPSDYVSYNELAGGGQAVFAAAEPQVPEWAHEAWARHAGDNPLVKRIERTFDSRPYRWSDVADMAAFRESPIFLELYAPLGIDHQIAFALPSPLEHTIGVALSRGGRDYSDTEREMLDVARPHLIQAYRNAQTRSELGELLGALPSALDEAGQGVVVTDGDGAVSLVSATASDWIERAAGAPVREGRPVPPALAEIAGTGTLSLPDGDAVLVRRVANSGAVVLLLELVSEALSPAALRGLGLTPREAEVLALLARGLETEVAAAELGLSVRTVHKHAQAIHAKLGVHNRAQAVATAWAAAGLRTAA